MPLWSRLRHDVAIDICASSGDVKECVARVSRQRFAGDVDVGR
jgi:hypothetical protein